MPRRCFGLCGTYGAACCSPRRAMATGLMPELPGLNPKDTGSECEVSSMGPKDGALYRATWETALEAGRNPDVQIVLSERGTGQKGQSNHTAAGFPPSFPQDSWGWECVRPCLIVKRLCPVKQCMRGILGSLSVLNLFSNCEWASIRSRFLCIQRLCASKAFPGHDAQ